MGSLGMPRFDWCTRPSSIRTGVVIVGVSYGSSHPASTAVLTFICASRVPLVGAYRAVAATSMPQRNLLKLDKASAGNRPGGGHHIRASSENRWAFPSVTPWHTSVPIDYTGPRSLATTSGAPESSGGASISITEARQAPRPGFGYKEIAPHEHRGVEIFGQLLQRLLEDRRPGLQ